MAWGSGCWPRWWAEVSWREPTIGLLLLGSADAPSISPLLPNRRRGECGCRRGLGLCPDGARWIPLLVFLALLFAAASYPAFRVLATALDRRGGRRIRTLSEQYGLAVNPEALVEDLPVGVQQRVEILKTLYREAEILILDEPTAVLTPQETEELVRDHAYGLTDQGKSIIFITHKLKEVMAIADRIIVLRNGRVTGQTTPAETTGGSWPR
jgi:ABC-type multidrug transport system ATPase subunit